MKSSLVKSYIANRETASVSKSFETLAHDRDHNGWPERPKCLFVALFDFRVGYQKARCALDLHYFVFIAKPNTVRLRSSNAVNIVLINPKSNSSDRCCYQRLTAK